MQKDHMAESIVFSPWGRTVIPLPSLHKEIQVYQDVNRQMSAWNKGHTASYFSAKLQPKCRHTSGRPELDGLTGGTGLTQLRWNSIICRTGRLQTSIRLTSLNPLPSNFVQECMESVPTANMMPHIP